MLRQFFLYKTIKGTYKVSWEKVFHDRKSYCYLLMYRVFPVKLDFMLPPRDNL